jgi:ubiquinone/menaquinone biosynthesis C-methylase UbiE
MMDPDFQRRVQRYGWDKAAGTYERAWRTQLEPAHTLMLDMVEPAPGERVLDVACGTGLVSFMIADAVGPEGSVVGTDISGRMVEGAREIAADRGAGNTTFECADAEALPFADASFDVVVCGLGLMYVPDPTLALSEMRRVLKPGGRAAAAVWGARANCGWAEIFPITAARVTSEVCPLFFRLGTQDVLARTFDETGFADVRMKRLSTMLSYASHEDALAAVFRGGPVTLAYSRFDEATRHAVHDEYLNSIAGFRAGDGFRIPGEFVVAVGRAPRNH